MEATEGVCRTGLKLKNSLTGKLVTQGVSQEQFVPTQGRLVKWYTCGPTVYSKGHLGHARNYIANDMIKRLLRDYFHYDVKLVMNITDVDDKIIVHSHREGVGFSEFARKWEKDFFQDMEQLNVEAPEVITRVSEYIPEIKQFIQKIIDNGYAYSSNGSVYFDNEKYRKNYKYGKLRRIQQAETEAEEEMTSDKKNVIDFALWKAAKEGEPRWSSDWGEGRPGWHIECSAMASSILGESMDIHSGGVDLIFPHHENQLTQSEAYFCHDKWVKFFLHVGHLGIDGHKVSRREKNFTPIKDVLKNISGRVLRLSLTRHRYDEPLNFSESALQEAYEKDKRYKNLFSMIKSVILRESESETSQKYELKDTELSDKFLTIKRNIHECLLNNLDTRGTFIEIDELVRLTNIYMEQTSPKVLLLRAISKYLLALFSAVGLNYITVASKKKFSALVDILVKFRDQVRSNAKLHPEKLDEADAWLHNQLQSAHKEQLEGQPPTTQ